MKLYTKFTNVDYSESLEKYAEEKLFSLEKFFTNQVQVNMTCYKDGHGRIVEFTVLAGHHHFKSKAGLDDFYTSLDLAFNKLKTQLKKQKAKMRDHKHVEESPVFIHEDHYNHYNPYEVLESRDPYDSYEPYKLQEEMHDELYEDVYWTNKKSS